MDISHTRGDTFIRNLAFTNAEGTAINLTGSTVKFTIKTNPGDASPVLQATAVVATPANGTGVVTFTAAQMALALGNYWYDIQLTDAGGVVSTILKGSFQITFDVTT